MHLSLDLPVWDILSCYFPGCVFCRATMDAAPRLSAFPRHWGGAGGHVDRFCIGVCRDAGPSEIPSQKVIPRTMLTCWRNPDFSEWRTLQDFVDWPSLKQKAWHSRNLSQRRIHENDFTSFKTWINRTEPFLVHPHVASSAMQAWDFVDGPYEVGWEDLGFDLPMM